MSAPAKIDIAAQPRCASAGPSRALDSGCRACPWERLHAPRGRGSALHLPPKSAHSCEHALKCRGRRKASRGRPHARGRKIGDGAYLCRSPGSIEGKALWVCAELRLRASSDAALCYEAARPIVHFMQGGSVSPSKEGRSRSATTSSCAGYFHFCRLHACNFARLAR